MRTARPVYAWAESRHSTRVSSREGAGGSIYATGTGTLRVSSAPPWTRPSRCPPGPAETVVLNSPKYRPWVTSASTEARQVRVELA